MGANNPTRQHYIPEFLIRHFLDNSGHLWVYDKGRAKVYPTNAKKAFVKNNIYTTHKFGRGDESTDYMEFMKSITKDYRHEVEFAQRIESNAAPVISQIIERARANNPPQLSHQQTNSWKSFVLAMARRTPESRRRATSLNDRDAFYMAAKARAHEVHYDDLPDIDSLYRDPRILELASIVMSNVHAQFAAGVSPRERREEEIFRRESGLCVAIICNPSPKNSFLIGSHGLAIVQSRHPDDAVTRSWLPIAHDVAVLATSFPDREFLLVIDEKRKCVVETINAASNALSHTIAGRSEELVRAFAPSPNAPGR